LIEIDFVMPTSKEDVSDFTKMSSLSPNRENPLILVLWVRWTVWRCAARNRYIFVVLFAAARCFENDAGF